MDLKGVRMQILHGPLARRVFFRAFFIATAMSIIPLIHILSGTYMTMFTFVNPGDCAAELGHVAPIERPFEVVGISRPGSYKLRSSDGKTAMLVGSSVSSPNSLIRSATPISSLLKSSSVVHVNYVNNFTLVVFKKNYDNAGLFEQYHLPADCPSLTSNRPFIGKMERLVKEKPVEYGKRFAYLPNFVDVSSKRRLVYIDIGAAAHLNANVTNWFLPSYPIERKDFNVYFVDHNTSVLLSYVKKPGITFVYHPGLAGIKPQVNVPIDGITDPYVGDEGFDFLVWFKETVGFADFVVLKMNAGNVELKFLTELFESGAICFVDELFLHCSGQVDAGGEMPVDCMDIFGSLRSSGVFVHQWWGDGNPGDVLLSVG
ncbi:hypothetical protein C1H46_044186 [Malus baccata]|uniref:DUF7870 domain-containing protein n=1 Tax=Malus baccata TaxID=106549 RepID=A0A540K7T2_MALBA|nr:hypothetical protein C1H46_044186 [Malus baccata]